MVPGNQEGAVLGLEEAMVLVEKAAAAQLLQKAAGGPTYPTPSLSPFSALPAPPVPMANPLGSWKERGYLIQKHQPPRGRWRVNLEGQQEYPGQG